MNCANQSISDYVKHNINIYNKGIDMRYVIQSFFGPHRFIESKNTVILIVGSYFILDDWINFYSRYIDHDIAYATVGLEPCYADKFDGNRNVKQGNVQHVSSVEIVNS